MNINATLGLVLFFMGLIFSVFRKQIVKILGPSKVGDYPVKVREDKMLYGGIMAIIGGFFVFLKFFEGF